LRAEAVKLISRFKIGPIFTPPVVSTWPGPLATLMLPDVTGGANWQGGSYDPETGTFYIFTNTNIAAVGLVPGSTRPNKASDMNYVRGQVVDPANPKSAPVSTTIQGLPLVKPPYGRITALDLNKGDLTWTIPNGDGPRFHPELKALNLPPLGQSVRAAPLVTKSLLFVTEGDQINVRTPPHGGGRKIRAFDKATGQIVWEYTMSAGSTGTLMTYLHNGKQFIVVAIGGIQHPAEFIAFALP
jgi:quinoprotein glucose dehydrogenase